MDCRSAVVRAIAFFDLFEQPLTAGEIWRWSREGECAFGMREVESEISRLCEEGKICRKEGMIFASDRPELPAVRESRGRHSARKWRIAARWAEFFAAIPGVELVGIGNTLAFGTAKDDSDIDFFVVSSPGALWRTRFFSALLPMLLGRRPTAESSRDRICLSFFVDRSAIGLGALSLGEGDEYFEFWRKSLALAAGQEDAAAQFGEKNGALARGRLAHSRFWPKFLRWIAAMPGDFLKKAQIERMPAALKDAARAENGSVIISDSVLKLHVADRRREIAAKLKKRAMDIGGKK